MAQPIPFRAWVAVYCLTGFIALGLEIAWFRVLGVLLNSRSRPRYHEPISDREAWLEDENRRLQDRNASLVEELLRRDREAADRQADRRALGQRVHRAPGNGGEEVCAGGLGILLLGGGGGLPEARLPLRDLGAEDSTAGGGVAGGAVEGVAR